MSFQFKGFEELYNYFQNETFSAILKKYNTESFYDLPSDRQAQINRVEKAYNDLKKMSKLTDADRALALSGILLQIKDEINNSYYIKSRVTNSEMYSQINPTLGVSAENPLSEEDKKIALCAAEKLQQHQAHFDGIREFNKANLKHVTPAVRQAKAILAVNKDENALRQGVQDFEAFNENVGMDTADLIKHFKRSHLFKVHASEKKLPTGLKKGDFINLDGHYEYNANRRRLMPVAKDRLVYDALLKQEPVYKEVCEAVKLFDRRKLHHVETAPAKKADAAWRSKP